MADPPQGCARVTGSVSGSDAPAAPATPTPVSADQRRESSVTARVGGKAPEFSAPAYYQGGFTTVNLSDFDDKWRLVCFYPGDFTFV